MIELLALTTSPISLDIMAAANGSSFDWTDFGPFGAAVVIAWFLLNRSDKVVEKEKLEAERDLQRAMDALEREKEAHEATRRLLYDCLHVRAEEEEPDEGE